MVSSPPLASGPLGARDILEDEENSASPFGRATPALGGYSAMLRLRRKRKRNQETALALADRARDGGDWALAARHYRDVLAKNPGRAAIWIQYGHALKESGNVAEAEKAYRQAIEIDGRNADSHLQLGHILKLQGRREDAVAAYFRALALEQPLSPAAGELLALCWERGEATARLEAAWNPNIPAFLNCVASVRAMAHEQERLARAVEELRRDLEARGENGRPARMNGGAAVGALPARE
jgi:tetratricopeptide (TPR) repeat protein